MKNKRMVAFRAGRTQKQVAQEMGTPSSTYAMIESGHRFPRKELQVKLARYFNTTVDELFFSEDDESRE